MFSIFYKPSSCERREHKAGLPIFGRGWHGRQPAAHIPSSEPVQNGDSQRGPAMDALFWILVALTLLAAIGHGIWLLAGLLFRGLAGLFGGSVERPIPAEMCPRCG